MSRTSEASVCAAVALSVGVLGGVCSDVAVVVVGLMVLGFSLPNTLPIVQFMNMS